MRCALRGEDSGASSQLHEGGAKVRSVKYLRALVLRTEALGPGLPDIGASG